MKKLLRWLVMNVLARADAIVQVDGDQFVRVEIDWNGVPVFERTMYFHHVSHTRKEAISSGKA